MQSIINTTIKDGIEGLTTAEKIMVSIHLFLIKEQTEKAIKALFRNQNMPENDRMDAIKDFRLRIAEIDRAIDSLINTEYSKSMQDMLNSMINDSTN